MRYIAGFIAVLACLTIGGVVSAQNISPSSNKAFGWANNQGNFGDEMAGYAKNLSDEGYITSDAIHRQTYGSNTTALTLPLFISEIKKGYATMDLAVDGGTGHGICVALYDATNDGLTTAQTAMKAAVDNGTVTANDVFVSLTHDGWGIFLRTDVCGIGMSAYYKPPSTGGIVFVNACWSSMGLPCLTINGAAFAIGNAGAIASSVALHNANTFWGRMSGELELGKRSASAAVSGLSLSVSGSGNVVLAPVITGYWPIENTPIVQPTPGWMTFDCPMSPNNVSQVLYGMNAVTVSNVSWVSNTGLTFMVSPIDDDDGTIVVSAFYLKTPAGIKLDGDGEGPNGDDFGIPVCASTTQYGGMCNLATGFEGAWAWYEGNNVHVLFSTWPEVGSDSMRVLGFETKEGPGTPLVTVPAHRRPWTYSLFVPSGYHHYGVVEVINGHEGDRGPQFALSSGPPENLGALLNQNTTLWQQWNTDAPRVLARISRAGTQQLPPANVLLYTSPAGSNFLNAFATVRDTMRIKFGWKTATAIGANSSALECRRAAEAQWNANLSAGWDAPVLWIIGESNQDTTSSLNIVGMYEYPDSTGECYFGNCSGPSWWTDFLGLGEKEMLIYQELVSSTAEAQNAAKIWLAKVRNSMGDPLTMFQMFSDFDNNVATNWYHGLAANFAQKYAGHGFAVTTHWLSEWSPFDYTTPRDTADAVFSRKGGMEVMSAARNSNRSRWGGIQKVNAPAWTGREVTVPQQDIAWMLTCDHDDGDRINTGYYPSLVKIWTTVSPDSYATMAAAVGYTRGGYNPGQDSIAVRLINKRFDGTASHPAQVEYLTERDMRHGEPALWQQCKNDFYRMYTVGGPVPMQGAPTMTAVSNWRVGEVLATLQSSPNPFRVSTSVGYSLTHAGNVTIRVFDISGRFVATLVDGGQTKGYHAVLWSGRNCLGRPVPSGMYLMRLETGTTALSHRVLRLD